jgi:hypothetical protein
MKKTALLIFIAGFATVAGFAQSSGSFSAMVLNPQCEILSSGSLNGGLASSTVLSTSVQTPNSSSTALVIRPSLVTGPTPTRSCLPADQTLPPQLPASECP